MPYSQPNEFEWDEAKAAANLRKHGVSFEQAAQVFSDPKRLTVADESNDEEAREITFGQVEDRILAVVHTERDGKIRIISARNAERKEHWAYYQLFPRSE